MFYSMLPFIGIESVSPNRVSLKRIGIKIHVGVLPENWGGVGLMLSDGHILDSNAVLGSTITLQRKDIIGVAVKNDNMSIIMSPDPPRKAYFCSGTVKCPEAKIETGINGAGSKYVGYEATETLRQCITYSGWAVNVAYNTMLNGSHCYLPYQGELLFIYNNRDIINDLLLRCGCSELPRGDYWSSALLGKVDSDGNSTNDANGYLKVVAGINFGGGQIWGLNVQGYYYVLPITRLN